MSTGCKVYLDAEEIYRAAFKRVRAAGGSEAEARLAAEHEMTKARQSGRHQPGAQHINDVPIDGEHLQHGASIMEP